MADYVALTSIYHGGVYAYHAGDAVPAANVNEQGYEVGVQVAEVNSEQGRAVLASLAGLPPGQQPETGPSFDPRKYSVPDVNAYLDEHPEDAERVLVAERETQHRKGIIEGPHAEAMPAPDVAEAAVSGDAEPDVAEA